MCWTIISDLEKAGKANDSSMPPSWVDSAFWVSGLVVGVRMKMTVAITSMVKIHMIGCLFLETTLLMAPV